MELDKSLFSRLKRLFSTDVIIHNKGGDQLKVIDINQIQQSGIVDNNSIIDRFRKIYSTAPTSLYSQQNLLNYLTLRPTLYSEYDAMDHDAIVASALDIIADESTLKNDFGEVLSIKSSDENIQKILYNLFYDVLNIEFNLWPWVRNMCKYGDFFLKLEIAEKYGVYNVIPYSAYHIERIEEIDRTNQTNTIKFKYYPEGILTSSPNSYNSSMFGPSYDNPKDVIFDNYEIAHFRLLADLNYLPFGRSFLEPARKLFKQYSMMEDSMLIHRIVRAPEKRIFYLNIGSIPPNEVENFIEKTISNLKRTPLIDEKTGDYNLKYNIQNLLEDYYIPIRGNDVSTKIENLNGLQWDGIEDVKYLRDKLFAALKIPRAFMGYDENTDGKATLAAQDIRFARTIERIQRIMVSELYKIALIHLYSQGYKGENLTNFELSLTTPSIIYDQERIELMKQKVELSREIIENKILPSDWIYENIFHFSENEYNEYKDLMIEDAKRKFRLTQIETEGNDPIESGESYGTPHDLASLYGKGRMESDPSNVPDGYNTTKPILGRPKEKSSNINTQDNNFSKDRLGKEGMKNDYNEPKNSNMYLESNNFIKKHLNLLKEIPNKKIIFENNKDKKSLLDESNLIDF
jgi:hypothetical protein